jgi:hypothetical protein
MPVTAPLRVPVELRREGSGRWFRLAEALSEEGLTFGRPLPAELDGPLVVTFHLPASAAPVAGGEPETAGPIQLTARREEVAADEGPDGPPAAGREVRFVRPEAALRARIVRYLQERLAS